VLKDQPGEPVGCCFVHPESKGLPSKSSKNGNVVCDDVSKLIKRNTDNKKEKILIIKIFIILKEKSSDDPEKGHPILYNVNDYQLNLKMIFY
jgi:hypothetical protein